MSSVPKPQRRNVPAKKPSCAPASSQARRQAATILEVLAGVRRPAEAAQVLETSLPRYYQLEQRALAGLLMACEPAPRGRQMDVSRQITALERENRRLQRECDRQQALVRATERALGLAMPAAVKSPVSKPAAKGLAEKPGGNGAKRRRTRRPTVRALKAAHILQGGEVASLPEEVEAVAGTGTPLTVAG